MSRPRWLRRFAGTMLVLLAGGMVRVGSAAEKPGVWRSNFAAARAEAEREEKPLLIHFAATWCVPCAKMDRDVLKTSDVKQLLTDRVVGVKLDFDQNKQLAYQYGVELLPTDIILDPASGRVLLESQGAMDLKKYLAFAASGENKFQDVLAKRQPPAAKPQDQPKSDAPPIVAEQKPKTAPNSRTISSSEPLIGLDGFSPVALTKRRAWVRGKPSLTWDYQGVTYQLDTQEELDEFRQDPGAFAPRLLGCDPVVLFDKDRAIPGKTTFGAFFDDELYLFTTAENRLRFKENPQRFTKTQHVLKADAIDRTATLDGSHLRVAMEPADAAAVVR